MTILARDTYREEGLTNPSRLRLINEVQHRVIRFLMGLIKNEEKRYADEEFVRIILWRPEDLELQRQLREAFDVMAQVVAGISEEGAPSLPKVLVHFVHGTFPRSGWPQLLWYAGYPFRLLRTAFPLPHDEAEKRCWFERGSELEDGVRKRLKKLAPYSGRVRFERFLWSGNNSFSARKKAAQELRWYLSAWRQAFPQAMHLILAHSHGGTVAVTAVGTTDKLAEGMMTLGTPFVRLVDRGPGGVPSDLQAAVGVLPVAYGPLAWPGSPAG
ncbi:MAG: hypothetical protein M3495_16655 [Pseudomonadota bacterium]|nr:hypothetical protein [Pseudomonadota bacterium]